MRERIDEEFCAEGYIVSLPKSLVQFKLFRKILPYGFVIAESGSEAVMNHVRKRDPENHEFFLTLLRQHYGTIERFAFFVPEIERGYTFCDSYGRKGCGFLFHDDVRWLRYALARSLAERAGSLDIESFLRRARSLFSLIPQGLAPGIKH